MAKEMRTEVEEFLLMVQGMVETRKEKLSPGEMITVLGLVLTNYIYEIEKGDMRLTRDVLLAAMNSALELLPRTSFLKVLRSAIEKEAEG